MSNFLAPLSELLRSKCYNFYMIPFLMRIRTLQSCIIHPYFSPCLYPRLNFDFFDSIYSLNCCLSTKYSCQVVHIMFRINIIPFILIILPSIVNLSDFSTSTVAYKSPFLLLNPWFPCPSTRKIVLLWVFLAIYRFSQIVLTTVPFPKHYPQLFRYPLLSHLLHPYFYLFDLL